MAAESYLQDADATLYLGDCLDVAWAAGLFEGEGCISMSGGGSGIVVHLSSSDRDVVERFARVVGVERITPRGTGESWKSHWKDQWQWSASGASAERVISLLLPFLGERRTARAHEVLATRRAFVEEATRERECLGCGVRFRPRMSPAVRRQTHCTMACYDRSRGRKHDVAYSTRERECEHCGESFAPRYSTSCARKRYCSHRCRQLAHRARAAA